MILEKMQDETKIIEPSSVLTPEVTTEQITNLFEQAPRVEELMVMDGCC